ncbi:MULTISPECIES: AraC family transcriptional regulator [Vagococcus]|uniref:DNA-binding response regulator, AraC family n=1 Tax=Vagococcus fluvialis bH819 TaxID=1255619 RepID=A0A1X6WP91_9ENTE|nr:MULTISPECIES: AraC family transcriptional regulator [Vagococcus]SLM86151.1 DNA-binding response regulator, AraC family [Vagococcus fluvialis bH819]HCM90399.1 AraC family transcriptional regulator [Vagococcus sp.]
MNIENLKQHMSGYPEIFDVDFSGINVLQIQKNKNKSYYHFATYFTVIHIFSGNSSVILNDESHELKEGGIFLVNLDIPFEIINKDQALISLLLIPQKYLIERIIEKVNDKSQLLEHFKNKEETNYLSFNTTLMEDPSYIIDRILCEYYDNWRLSDVLVESLLISLVVELERFYNQKILHKKALTSVQSFMAYIKRNYRDHSLEQMADFFNYHPNYLSARLKQETGQSYLELIQAQRLKVAKGLLENSNLSVEQISYECGYSSSSFFYKKFKKFFNVTPVEFKKSLK